MAFSGGVALPEENYASKSTTAPGGYAGSGGNLNFTLGLTPAHFPIGFAVMGGYYFNRYQFNDFIGNQQASDVNSTYGTNLPNVNRLVYSGFYGMGGLCEEIMLNKIAFDFRGLIGSLGVTTPELSYYATQPGPVFSTYTTTWDISDSRGSAFCYDLGITARVKRVDNVNVIVNFDFTRSVIPYSTGVLYTDRNGNTSSYVTTSNLTISFISFSIGFGYDIGD